MGKFNFYFNQGRASLKRSALVIIGLTVAISMVAGLNFYLDAYQSQSLEENYTFMEDVYIFRNSRDEQVVDYASTFHGEVNDTMELFEANEYYIDEWYEFYQTSSSDFFPQSEEEFTYTIFPTSFYQSNRFLEYFTIYSGSAPVESDEILIAYSYALAQNLSVKDTIRYNYSSEGNDDSIFTEVLNTTIFYEIDFVISGIVLPNRPYIRVLNSYYVFPQCMDLTTQEIKINPDYNSYYYNRYPIFASFNFSQSIPHPVQTMWNNVSEQITALTGDFRRCCPIYHRIDGNL